MKRSLQAMAVIKLNHAQLTKLQARAPYFFDAEITRIEKLSLTVKRFDFRVRDNSNGRVFSYLPGQWVDLVCPGVRQVGGFSFISVPSQLPMFGLAVKESAENPPVVWLHEEAKVGSVVKVKPGGNFAFPSPEPNKQYLLLAGGIGITPLFSIFQHFSQNFPDTKLALIHSAKTADDFIFKPELSQAIKRLKEDRNIKVVFTATGSADSCERTGRIDKAMVEETMLEIDANIKNLKVLLCGPSGFEKSMVRVLVALGIAQCDIEFERWW